MQATKIFSIVATSLTIILNVVGLKLVHRVRNIKPSQKVLLSNLSISDTLNAIVVLSGIFLIENLDQAYGFETIAAHCILVSCEALIIITVDRVIATAMPFKYNIIVTKRRLIGVVFVVWVLTLVSITTLVQQTKVWDIHSYTFFITSPTEMVIFASYVFILLKMKKSRKRSTSSTMPRSFTETKQGRKMMIMSSCIVLSFAAFVAVPDTIMFFTNDKREYYLAIVQIYYFINPVIYIYCYPPLRCQIMTNLHAIRRAFNQKNQIAATDVGEEKCQQPKRKQNGTSEREQ